MPDVITTNHNFILPEIGASKDTWGSKLNSNFSYLDALLSVNATGAFMPRAGGQFNGVVTLAENTDANKQLLVKGATAGETLLGDAGYPLAIRRKSDNALTHIISNANVTNPDVADNIRTILTRAMGDARYPIAGQYVPPSRNINVTDGLSGGGSLSGDVTIAVNSSVVRTSGDQIIAGIKYLTAHMTVFGGATNTTIQMRRAGNIVRSELIAGDTNDFYIKVYNSAGGAAQAFSFVSNGNFYAPGNLICGGEVQGNYNSARIRNALGPNTAHSDVGTYAMMRYAGASTPLPPGTVVNGANLRLASADGDVSGFVPQGNWILFGYVTTATNSSRTSLWFRRD